MYRFAARTFEAFRQLCAELKPHDYLSGRREQIDISGKLGAQEGGVFSVWQYDHFHVI